MPRSDWLVVAALVGCLGLAAAGLYDAKHDHREASAYSADACRDSDVAARPAIKPPVDAPARKRGGDGHDSGDYAEISCESLSAQATVIQARAANTQSLIGVAQTFLTLFTLFAAVAAAVWARKAADETERSADAAVLAQRPWLDVQFTLKGVSFIDGGLGFRVHLVINNIGNTPATNINVVVTGHLFDTTFETKDTTAAYFAAQIPIVQKRRDLGIIAAIASAREKVAATTEEGRSLFPSDKMNSYVEAAVKGKVDDRLITGYFVAAVSYNFTGHAAETVKVFEARVIDRPNESGFDYVGSLGMNFTEIDQTLEPWPQFGYVS